MRLVKAFLLSLVLVLSFSYANGQNAVINGDTVYQKMDGFGGQTWTYADSMSSSQADLFFSSSNGIGLAIARTANTWDGGIPDLSTLQQAVARGAKVELGLQSPPCALKHSYVDLGENCSQSGDAGNQPLAFNDGSVGSSYTCFANGLSLDGAGGAFDQYATYIVNLIKNYQSHNIPITWLSVQNEANISQSSLGACLWMNGSQFQDFIKNYLGPRIAAAGLSSVQILLDPMNDWFDTDAVSACLNDSGCSQYVPLVGGHGYPYPYSPSYYSLGVASGRRVWQSETSDQGGWDPGMGSALTMARSIHDFLTVGHASAYQWWELAYTSSAGNFGLTDSSFNTTKRFWVTGNWSKFVRPGWSMISATASPRAGVFITAFKNTSSGAFAIVAINSNYSSISQTVNLSSLSANSVTPYVTDANNNLAAQSALTVSGGSLTATLNAQSVTTFVGGGSSSLPPPPSNLTGVVQ